VPARVVCVTSAVVALAAAAASQAPATTGIEVTIPVTITLTDRGVAFSHKLKPNTASTIAATVVNKSSKPRRFKLGWRRTKLLQLGGREHFYYSFSVPGVTRWFSTGARAKQFHGRIFVKLGNIYGADYG
jgi:hypothetical protein